MHIAALMVNISWVYFVIFLNHPSISHIGIYSFEREIPKAPFTNMDLL